MFAILKYDFLIWIECRIIYNLSIPYHQVRCMFVVGLFLLLPLVEISRYLLKWTPNSSENLAPKPEGIDLCFGMDYILWGAKTKHIPPSKMNINILYYINNL